MAQDSSDNNRRGDAGRDSSRTLLAGPESQEQSRIRGEIILFPGHLTSLLIVMTTLHTHIRSKKSHAKTRLDSLSIRFHSGSPRAGRRYLVRGWELIKDGTEMVNCSHLQLHLLTFTCAFMRRLTFTLVAKGGEDRWG